VVVAGLALTDRLVRFEANWLSWLLPAVLVLAGVAVLVRTARDHRGAKR
jgi:cytochrome c-type biogenesis protein CcmH/NrfF